MLTAEQHLERKTIKTSECWIWDGVICRDGYGRFELTTGRLQSKILSAHRVAYELSNGKIPKGLTIDHLCRNRRCVNPQHLEAVTIRENTIRGYGMAGINHRKKNCINGHPFDAVNTKIKNGNRVCIACKKRLDKEYQHRRRKFCA